jgi:hypothetical protein
VRRPTLIVILVLFTLIAVAAVGQFVIASGDRRTFNGPTSPGQLPSLSAAPTGT